MTRDFSTRPRPPARSALDVALVAAGVLALAWSAACAHGSWRDAREKRARVEAARRELAAVRERASPASPSGTEGFARQALLSLEAAPPVVLGTLGALMPADVRLDALAFEYREQLALRLDVVARDAAAYDLFLSRLESSPSFGSVTPGEENRDGEVRATVRATYGGGAR